MARKVTSHRPVAFSYLRFSSRQQAAGDSVRRQTELRDTWLAKSGAVLDTSLSLRDEGVSGYTGEHRKNPDRNALANFLQLVERGRIPRGSYLVCENLDRLSREDIRPALTLLLNLIDRGIRVVQLTPVEQVFDEQVEPMVLMQAIMELSRGHNESKLKSQRITAGWKAVKENARKGIVATRHVPGWLRVDGDKIVAVPERVRVVRKMFGMAKGGHSLAAICRKLNGEGIPTFGPGERWIPGTVRKILTGRSVLGEFQPHRQAYEERTDGGTARTRRKDGEPVAGYYPKVVEEPVWLVVQAELRRRTNGGRTPRGGVWNPFSGLLKDARDGEPVYAQHPTSRNHATLVNGRAMKGLGGTFVSFPLDPFVTEVLNRLREIDPRELSDGDAAADDALTVLEAKRDDLTNRIAVLRSELERGVGEVRAAVAALRVMESELDDVTAEAARLRAESATPLTESLADGHGLIDAMEKARDPGEARLRLRSILRRVIQEVRVLFVAKPGRVRVAVAQVYFTGGASRSYLVVHRPAQKNQHTEGQAAETKGWSFAEAGVADYDLRDRKDVAELEKFLASVELDALEKFLDAGRPRKRTRLSSAGRTAV